MKEEKKIVSKTYPLYPHLLNTFCVFLDLGNQTNILLKPIRHSFVRSIVQSLNHSLKDGNIGLQTLRTGFQDLEEEKSASDRNKKDKSKWKPTFSSSTSNS